MRPIMNDVLFEVLIVILLILLNGFFSGTEMAFITLRKTRVQELAKKNHTKALLVQKILNRPEKFLATVQIGITMVSTIASAFAGANIAAKLEPWLEKNSWPMIAENAQAISFAVIVIGITYFSIVLGELIPKSLGIKFSEKFAFFAVYPLHFLSVIASPVSWFLTASSNVVLKIFRDKTSFSEARISEDELRAIIYESHKAGVLEKQEHEMLDNVFDFADIAVSEVMTARAKIFAIDIDKSDRKNIKFIVDSEYTRIPVYRKSLNNIIGILNIKDLLSELQKGTENIDLEQLTKKACFISGAKHISVLLKKFQKEKIHMAVVVNERDRVVGIVTIEDILEEIVGDIADETDEEG